MNADFVELASAELLAVDMTHKKVTPSDGQCRAQRSRFKTITDYYLLLWACICSSRTVLLSSFSTYVRGNRRRKNACAVTYGTDTTLPSN